MNSWWLNRKTYGSLPNAFDSLVTDIREKSMLPTIRDNMINSLIRQT
jgi:hypothetical protein